jgi:extradiol dioxygenase family protein
LLPSTWPFRCTTWPLTRQFYGQFLGCPKAVQQPSGSTSTCSATRSWPTWRPGRAPDHHNPVDGHDVPVPHFGVVLDWDDFHALADRCAPRASPS